MHLNLTLNELLFFDDSLTLNMRHSPGFIKSQLLDSSSNMIIAAPECLINKIIDGVAYVVSEKKKEVVLDMERLEIMILREVVKISNKEILTGKEMLELKMKIISCLHEVSEDYTKIQNAREYLWKEEAKNEK